MIEEKANLDFDMTVLFTKLIILIYKKLGNVANAQDGQL